MHNSILQQLSYIVPALSISFLIAITSINFYLKIRRKFPITVNCWFCNENTKVPYTQSNSWTCPSCEQYNGFTADGDYNCDIPSQRSSKLNKIKGSNFSIKDYSINGSVLNQSLYEPASNGLCELCNRNQELKMQQLASFEPDDEAYFDEEVENYRKKLEQAYRLCPRCERHLKRTLNRVKNNILGSKLAQIGAKGLRAFDLQGQSKKLVQQKRQFFAKLCVFVLFIISILNVYKTSQSVNITKAKLDTVFNQNVTSTILIVLSYLTAFKILFTNFCCYVSALPYITYVTTAIQLLCSYFCVSLHGNVSELLQTETWQNVLNTSALPIEFDIKPVNDNETIILDLSGCLLAIFLIFLTGLKTAPIISLMLWSLDMALPTMFLNKTGLIDELVMDTLKLFIIWMTTTLSIWNWYTLTQNTIENKAANNSFHRIYSECNSDASDESDVEDDLNTSIRSTGSNCSVRSRKTVKSINSTLNNSIHSISPIGSSTSRLRKHLSSSAYSLNHFVHQPHMSSFGQLNKANQKNECRSLFGSTQSIYSAHSDHLLRQPFGKYKTQNPNFPVTRSRFGSPTSTIFSAQTHKPFEETDIRCSSRNSCRDIPDDFESGITQLSISGLTEKRFNHSNGFNGLHLRNTTSSGCSSSLRRDNQILLPARLNYNNGSEFRALPVNQTSWLAGGYWNSTSPKKINMQSQQPIFNQTNEVFPIISRTSSQSSGFESQSSSTKNGQGNNSRENSLCHEMDGERESVVPSPLGRSLKSGGQMDFQSTLLNNGAKHNDNNKFFNLTSQYQRITLNDTFTVASPKSSSAFSSGDTLKTVNLPKSFSLDSSNPQKTSSPFHFKPLHKNLSAFRKGSLLKIAELNAKHNDGD